MKSEDIESKWNEVDYETRLLCTEYVFSKILDHAKEGGTYRYLIYDRLGFNMDAYGVLLDGLEISNEFSITESFHKDENAMNLSKDFHRYTDNIPLFLSEEDKAIGKVNDERFRVYSFYWAWIDLNRELSKQESKFQKLEDEIKERDAIINKTSEV